MMKFNVNIQILVVFVLLFWTSYSNANNTNEAFKKTTEAISQTRSGKQILQTLERQVQKLYPFNNEMGVFIGSAAITLASGKIDTQAIKNMEIKIGSGKLRSDIEYKISGEVGVQVQYGVQF